MKAILANLEADSIQIWLCASLELQVNRLSLGNVCLMQENVSCCKTRGCKVKTIPMQSISVCQIVAVSEGAASAGVLSTFTDHLRARLHLTSYLD